MKMLSRVLFGAVVLTMGCVVYSTADWGSREAARWAWLPGTLLGVLGGMWGGTGGSLASRGVGRDLVILSGWLLVAACAVMLVGGLTFLVMGRPYYLWYPWVLPGAIGCVVFGRLVPAVSRRYQEAEARRMAAKDIASG